MIISHWRTVVSLREANESLKERIAELEEALQEIAQMSGKTLLGGRDLESDRAHELGANKAFEQAANIARTALGKAGEVI